MFSWRIRFYVFGESRPLENPKFQQFGEVSIRDYPTGKEFYFRSILDITFLDSPSEYIPG
jgi:hypothetical protein